MPDKMPTLLSEQFKISHAASILRMGGILAYPTEAIFGLGCDPNNTRALTRLLTLKQRTPDQGFILLTDSFDVAQRYFHAVDDHTMREVQKSWPGPTTWVLPAHNVHPLVTGGRDTVAIRVSAHPLCQKLCHKFGDAIVSTSANISQRTPAKNSFQLRLQFGTKLDGVLNGPLGQDSRPSRIINAMTKKIIRH